MQQITNRHLLKFLPIDEKIKLETLSYLDKFSEDQTLELNKLLWLMFYELVDAEAKYELEQALADIKDNKRTLEPYLFGKLKQQIFLRFMRDLREEQELEAVGEAREKLKALVIEKYKTQPFPKDKSVSPSSSQKT